jgi:hypothetical protein
MVGSDRWKGKVTQERDTKRTPKERKRNTKETQKKHKRNTKEHKKRK